MKDSYISMMERSILVNFSMDLNTVLAYKSTSIKTAKWRANLNRDIKLENSMLISRLKNILVTYKMDCIKVKEDWPNKITYTKGCLIKVKKMVMAKKFTLKLAYV
jgi:hypothetical protein